MSGHGHSSCTFSPQPRRAHTGAARIWGIRRKKFFWARSKSSLAPDKLFNDGALFRDARKAQKSSCEEYLKRRKYLCFLTFSPRFRGGGFHWTGLVDGYFNKVSATRPCAISAPLGRFNHVMCSGAWPSWPCNRYGIAVSAITDVLKETADVSEERVLVVVLFDVVFKCWVWMLKIQDAAHGEHGS